MERKVRPDGSEYIVGVRKSVRKAQTPPPKEDSSSDDGERNTCDENVNVLILDDSDETKQAEEEGDWERIVPLAVTTLAPGVDSEDEEQV